jgi:hypothetical protein
MVISVSAIGQITVPISTFPKAGDTLRTAIDNLPGNLDIGEAGANKTWFFNGLQAPFVNETLIRPAQQGNAASSFPNASYFIRSNDNLETYYRINNNRVHNLGFAGTLPVELPIEARGRFDGPGLVERYGPLKYQDQYNDDRTLSIPFSAAFIPDTFFAGLPIRPDSIRLRVRTQNAHVVDAWGTMIIPSGAFEVLRQKTTTISTRTLEGKTNAIPFWIPIPIEFPGITGVDTSLTYTFWSDQAKEPIAVVSYGPGDTSPFQVEFKADNQVITNTYSKQQKAPGMFAYPNPAIGSVRFDLVGLDPGQYTLRMYNVLGVEVYSKKYSVNGPRTIKLELGSFNKGTYFYSLIDDRGKIIVTKRLVVLRP